MENRLSLGALAPAANSLQGLKAQPVAFPEAAGLKPRPSKVPSYDGDFRHRAPAVNPRATAEILRFAQDDSPGAGMTVKVPG